MNETIIAFVLVLSIVFFTWYYRYCKGYKRHQHPIKFSRPKSEQKTWTYSPEDRNEWLENDRLF